MNSVPLTELTDTTIRDLVNALESLTDGELAVDILIACGSRAVPFLSKALLDDAPQSIAASRCRVVRALGGLGEEHILLQYLRDWKQAADPAVAMAEDAVRSAAAKELLRWPSQELFDVLLVSIRRRASLGLVEALGAFGRAEAVPVLFSVLQDDICRNSAKEILRKTPGYTKTFALQLLIEHSLEREQSPSALHLLRSSLALLSEMNISKDEWDSIRPFLIWEDVEIVITCAEIGVCSTPAKEHPVIVHNVFRILPDCNWLQESRVIDLLKSCGPLARPAALTKRNELISLGAKPSLLNPVWRVIERVLGAPASWKKNGDAA